MIYLNNDRCGSCDTKLKLFPLTPQERREQNETDPRITKWVCPNRACEYSGWIVWRGVEWRPGPLPK